MGFSVENNRVIGVDLYKCEVSILPESISNLSSLEKLWIDENQLMTLPESIKILERRGVKIFGSNNIL